MAKPDSWMAFYGDDFQADTNHCSAAERGAYMDLLWACWRRGNELPSTADQLMRLARCTLSEWKSVRENVMAFFTKTDAGWNHKRIGKELAEARDRYEKKSRAGSNGAAKRWHTPKQNDSTAIAEPLANGCTTHNSHSPSGENTDAIASVAPTPPATKSKPRRTRLESDWQPSPDDYQFAVSANLNHAEIAADIIEFVAYWTGSEPAKPLKADWSRTYQNHIRDYAPRIIARRPRAVGTGSNRPGVGSVFAALSQNLAAGDVGGQGHAGNGMGRGTDSDLFVGSNTPAGSPNSPETDRPFVDADYLERVPETLSETQVHDESPQRIHRRHSADVAVLRRGVGEVSNGCGSEGFDDTDEPEPVVASLVRTEGALGPVCEQTQTLAASADYEPDVGPRPDFLTRKPREQQDVA